MSCCCMRLLRRRTITCLLGVALVTLGVAQARAADSPAKNSAANPDDNISQMLAAGEFAPARALAEQQPPAERDGLLAQVAQAQFLGGARDASWQTVGAMTDDRSRATALGKMAGHGAPGGGVQPDFESLIDLITSTIKPTSWDTVGGPGAVKQFAGGVYFDAAGTLRRTAVAEGPELDRLRDRARAGTGDDLRRDVPLRKVSLPRLERAIQLRTAAGLPLDDSMRVLAGIQRIEYVFAYPETGDIVIAGPAGDWTLDVEQRTVGTKSGRPTLRLDDLLVVFRQGAKDASPFGCSITPTQDRLASTRALLEASSQNPLKPDERKEWLERVRSTLGPQNIDVYGIDPTSRTAQVLVEADYRMKLVGIGLEKGVLGVRSYLDSIHPGEAPPAIDVLRWWFAARPVAFERSQQGNAYKLGATVRVLSENELLEDTGQRVHTGKSNILNEEFALSFTDHFAELAQKYPIYAELENIFDLALVSALVRTQGLADSAGWHMTEFGEQGLVATEHGPPPTTVDTVMNSRVIGRKNIVAAVSGGVRVDVSPLVAPAAIKTDKSDRVNGEMRYAQPAKDLSRDRWWWD